LFFKPGLEPQDHGWVICEGLFLLKKVLIMDDLASTYMR